MDKLNVVKMMLAVGDTAMELMPEEYKDDSDKAIAYIIGVARVQAIVTDIIKNKKTAAKYQKLSKEKKEF